MTHADITLEKISRTFKNLPLLSDVSWTFERGRSYGIKGPNGSGKSVLLRMMCHLAQPDSGRVVISEELLSPERTFPEKIGVIIDRPGYLPHRTGLDNLRYLAGIRGVISEEDILAVMRRLGLDPALRQPVSRYSLGMKQKLAIAQAVMEDQQLLLLDEPFNALDQSSVEVVMKLLQEKQDQGVTIIFTSHQTEEMARLAQEVLLINDQQLQPVQLGGPGAR